MSYRLDLQTQRDVQADAQRLVEVAKNTLLPDLELTGTLGTTTDPTRRRAGVELDLDETSFSTGLRFGLPLDREIERVNVRRAQIELERAKRDLDLLRDNVIVQVRSAVRDIDRAIFTLEIQERSIEIGRQRIESIEAAPDRASARDASDAANEFARAQDRRDSARRDLQVAILRYLLETGQLRVDPHGFIRPLNGMEINGEVPVSIPALPSLGHKDASSTHPNGHLAEKNPNLVR
jgi:outer membrane protein TolC